ncbi:hypothetical protein R5R35_013880 [Gryllus longicercus]|uniref:RanBP2-type domain-containing protein n=1 Tax=Gryllus longicercus TaxID=2509291 RepID=A0AAN9VT16_9ORTH
MPVTCAAPPQQQQQPAPALLERQLERKTRLQRELRREREKLRAMQRDVRGMEKDLAQRQLRKRSPHAALPHLSTLQKVQRLRQEIHLLTEECKKMTMEVDMSSDSRLPLGETDEEFYQNIYTGQRGSVAAHSQRVPPRHPSELPHQSPRQPPPRPPPPERDPREGQSWTCTECTFRNYWELEYCEQCEMPRLMLGGETQDIHIHVTHHNFPIRSYLTVGS